MTAHYCLIRKAVPAGVMPQGFWGTPEACEECSHPCRDAACLCRKTRGGSLRSRTPGYLPPHASGVEKCESPVGGHSRRC
jgi:hypothetical protein